MKKVLFACAENKKRSQMAEAIFNHLAKKTVAESAGTMPAKVVDPKIEGILAERGISFTPHTPRKISDTAIREADFIISFGCLVPSFFPKEKFEEWVIDDPETPEEYRQAGDNIFKKVRELITKHICSRLPYFQIILESSS